MSTIGKDMKPTPPRVAIVTAASRGIGAACARQLAADGYHVALMARSEQVRAVAEEVDGFAVRGDLTQPRDIARLIDAVGERWGRLDVLVNNAGDAARGDPETLPDAALAGRVRAVVPERVTALPRGPAVAARGRRRRDRQHLRRQVPHARPPVDRVLAVF